MKLKYTDSEVKDCIFPLDINGMTGRMLVLPPKNSKHTQEIMFIYGVHATLERVASTAQFLSNYGRVTIPDLPGMGGMDTFYKIDLSPTLDTYADYLASLIKLRYRGKKITLIGMSFGFVIITRMLQKYPDIRKKIALLISMVGISDSNNIAVSPSKNKILKALFISQSHNPTSWIMKTFILKRGIVGLLYTDHHPKMKGFSKAERSKLIDYETYLWQCNDLKTYGNCMYDIFTFHHPDIKVPLPLHHIGTEQDQWLNNKKVVESHTKIYSSVTNHKAQMDNHGASLIADENEAASIIPNTAKKLLKKYAQ